MSRTTTLQLIAAVITIAILAVLHQGLDWFFHLMSVDYALGVMTGAVVVLLVWFYEDRKDRLSRAVGDIPSAEQQRARHSIDL
ncbi:MAG: hypothetical protein EOQ55_00625 [Mesorhizobium sp.]|uniref:hypothetical protein n=1 Tax=unclassified Mesorhizobium TaxID=325217 RepID=UPI000FCB609A|nr:MULTISPECIES: hypothetical protein [unclassified Mesorhizobium]RUV41069.1 hypothetical protein EOD29_25125 [Mesorhizobium sp. M1A.T.Ca.IN.004.03.1.1]RWG23294.1 MAG: hypothetical protein EOQ55_00625 [Mesorhizobium sp.]RWG60507.1 MAG: hypothetical protein EOQ64_01650 [Mesorhizobium sp.]RWH42118.1 MAG: hypothetical protein EOQ78_17760 [Mesorhizobium sp.]RWK30836.1 MAG: hypothetical protein EOR40_24725 [Mesorhizobium sp.]